MLPEILQPVNVRVTANIFARAVIDRLMAKTEFLQVLVGVPPVRVNHGAFPDVILNDGLQSPFGSVWHNLCDDRTIALEHSKHDCLVGVRGPSLGTLADAANVGLIHLDRAEQRPFTVNAGHVGADEIGHAPSRLIRHAKLALQFLRGNAVAGSGEQVDGVKPELQRRATVLERCSDRGVKVIAAPLAGIGALGLYPVPVGLTLAFRAGMALAKACLKQVLNAGFVRWKLGEELADGEGGFLFHALKMGKSVTYVKGIVP